MGFPIRINAISIDLADAANATDNEKCNHFSIRGFLAETRKKDKTKSWPFLEESFTVSGQENYSLPLSVPNFRWWRCTGCVKDINPDGTTESNDCGLHSNTKTNEENNMDGDSLVIIPRTSNLNLLSDVIDQEKERETDIAAGNAIFEENENANTERAQTDDHQTATILLEKAHPPATNGRPVRSKRKLTNPEQKVGNKRSRGKAKQVEDKPAKATKTRRGKGNMLPEIINPNMNGSPVSKKTRLLSQMFIQKANAETSGGSSKNNIIIEESGSKSESVRGRKRNLLPDNNSVSKKLRSTTSESASKLSDCDGESTDSGLDRDPIKGKLQNRRFQVVDEYVPLSLLPETSQERIHENDADPGTSTALTIIPVEDSVPCPPSTQRTEKKLALTKKKTQKPVIDNAKSAHISFSTRTDEESQVKPQNGPLLNAVSQLSTRDLLNEKRVGKSVVEDRLASERYFREYTPKSNTGGWLRTGVHVAEHPGSNSNNNTNISSFGNFKQHTPTTAEIVDLSSVLQKGASIVDRKGKMVMVQENEGKVDIPEESNDDIPMEIVELMAKNQYERGLPDKGEEVSNKQPPQETPTKSKNGLLIDLNETYEDNNNNNTSRQPTPRGNNDAIKDGHFLIEKPKNAREFFPIRKPYTPFPSSPPPPSFGIFPSTQESRAASSSILVSGQSRHWLGNIPTMATNQNPSPTPFHVQCRCNTCQSVPPQYREASHPPTIWSSAVTTQAQGYHPHKHVFIGMDQSTRPGIPSQAPPSINGNTWNLNFVSANGKQNSGAAGSSHGSRSADAYPSENSIPAMQLLGLMDPRLRSTTPTDHNDTKFTERRFLPVTEPSTLNFYNTRLTPEASRTGVTSNQNAQASWSHLHQQHEEYNGPPSPVNKSRDKQRILQLLGESNYRKPPLRYYVSNASKKEKGKADGISNASASASAMKKDIPGPMVCCVNRNPADFTVPEPGNGYMITGESLKVRKRAAVQRKPRLCKQDASKQSKKT